MKPVLFVGLVLFVGNGCVTVTPVGPMAKALGPQPIVQGKKPKPADLSPTVVPAPTPPTPSVMINADEVTTDNHQDVVQRLTREMEADRKSTPPPSATVEVSRVKP